MQPLDKVAAGEKFHPSAAERNAVVDLWRDFQTRRQDGTSAPLSVPTASPTVVDVANTTGASLDRFSILGIERPLANPGTPDFFNQVALKGRAPQPNDALVVLLGDVAPDMVVRAAIDGVVPARVDLQDETHGFAVSQTGNTTALQSAPDGPVEIVWSPGGFGRKWCLVRLRGHNPPQPRELVRFELIQPLDLMGAALGRALAFNGATWSPVGPAIAIRDTFPFPGRWQGYPGYRGWGAPSGDTDPLNPTALDVVEMDTIARSIRFTLTTALGYGNQVNDSRPVGGPGATASAVISGFFLQGRDPTEALGSPITVHDPSGLFPWALAGAKGLARWNDRDRRYEVIQVQQVSPLLDGVLAAPVCSTDLWAIVKDVSAMTHSPFNQKPSAVPVVQNQYGLAGVANTPCLIAWDQSLSAWVLAQVMHVPASLAFDYRIVEKAVQSPLQCTGNCSGASGSGSGSSSGGCTCSTKIYETRLQVRRATFAVMSCADPSQSPWLPTTTIYE